MKDTIHGFKFTSSREISDISAILHEGYHERSGARLIYLEREDENKTFAITFKTIPEDSTGVFHILEHSVLCGSEKYPVKEPFVDLLKSSLKTFLNAMTFSDKTMYPVSSRCEADFYNLINVYMDAVLHPLALSKPEIFYQEGWHYEIESPEDEMSYKGVVFNEMKGAYSSPDSLEDCYLSRMLYSGTPYSHDSGGHPAEIPTLTYEDFTAAHKKYYHPENSAIYLDGTLDIEETLKLLDSYLKDFQKTGAEDFKIERIAEGDRTSHELYELSPNESPDGKERIAIGFGTFPYNETKKLLALRVLLMAIASTNESPLKSAMIKSGLVEDMYFTNCEGLQDCSLIVTLKNIKSENTEAALKLFYKTLEDIAEQGIDKELLLASVNRREFIMREQDSSGYPIGLANGISVMEHVLYGGDAAAGLCFESDLKYIRDSLSKESFYEDLIREVFLNSRHKATLYMSPSQALADDRANEERERLSRAKTAMSAQELASVIEKGRALCEWQSLEDSDEASATIPKLSLSDIPDKPYDFKTNVYKIADSTVAFTPQSGKGITYISCAFDATDLDGNELFMLSMLTELIGELSTKELCARELGTQIRSVFGFFGASVTSLAVRGKAKCYAKLSFGLVDQSKEKSLELIRQALLLTLFDDTAAIKSIIRQAKLGMYDELCEAGHSVALRRAAAYASQSAAAADYMTGIGAYRLLCKLDSEFESAPAAAVSVFSELSNRIFTKARLTLFLSGERDDAYAEKIISLFPEGERCTKDCPIEPLGALCEGIAVPSQVSYAAMAGRPFDSSAERLPGYITAIRSILSYGHLWNEIRVRGGAYGAGFTKTSGNLLGFYSYRDPSAYRTLDIFRTSADYLRELADSGEPLTDYIIGAVGDSDPLYTPRTVAHGAVTEYLSGESLALRTADRRRLMSLSHADLLECADLIDRLASFNAVCVVAGKEKLLECGERLKTIIDI